MTDFEERCLQHKFEIVDASVGIDQEKDLEMEKDTAMAFKIDVYESDEHQFNVRMTTADGVQATSPMLHGSRRKLSHFDCTSYISFPSIAAEYRIQKDNTANRYTFVAATTDSTNCPLLSYGWSNYGSCAYLDQDTLDTTTVCDVSTITIFVRT